MMANKESDKLTETDKLGLIQAVSLRGFRDLFDRLISVTDRFKDKVVRQC